MFAVAFVLTVIVCVSVFPFANATYTQREKIIDCALNEVGYTQKDGYNKFSAAFGNGYTAWCNYFVVWCAKQTGVSAEAITGRNSYDGNCYIYMNALRQQGRFFENDGSYTPKKGDLVFYNSSKSTNGSTHIGFVLEADENTVTTVEGNVTVNGTRGVGKNVRPRYSFVGDMIIIGFGVPAYSDEEVPKEVMKKSAEIFASSNKINASEFETNATVDERIESIKKLSSENICTNIDFVTVVKAPYFASVKMSCDCVTCK